MDRHHRSVQRDEKRTFAEVGELLVDAVRSCQSCCPGAVRWSCTEVVPSTYRFSAIARVYRVMRSDYETRCSCACDDSSGALDYDVLVAERKPVLVYKGNSDAAYAGARDAIDYDDDGSGVCCKWARASIVTGRCLQRCPLACVCVACVAVLVIDRPIDRGERRSNGSIEELTTWAIHLIDSSGRPRASIAYSRSHHQQEDIRRLPTIEVRARNGTSTLTIHRIYDDLCI